VDLTGLVGPQTILISLVGESSLSLNTDGDGDPTHSWGWTIMVTQGGSYGLTIPSVLAPGGEAYTPTLDPGAQDLIRLFWNGDHWSLTEVHKAFAVTS
jgi:hypothetical protein